MHDPQPVTQPDESSLRAAELEALLHYNGFSVESHTGDFTGEPITPATESQVVVAKLRSGYSRRSTSQ